MSSSFLKVGKLTCAESDSEASLREALDVARSGFPMDAAQWVVPLERLADFYGAQGELCQAKPYLREAAEIRIRLWGARHPGLVAALRLLARIAIAEGKLQRAEEYLNHAVKCLSAVQPSRSVELAETWSQLAELRFRAGDVRQARKLCRTTRAALNGELKHLPQLALRLRNNQGAIHLSQGRPKRALRCFVKNLRQIQLHSAADDPALITHWNNIAESLYRQGELRRADSCLRRALGIARRNWGWRHAVTAATCQHLAHVRSLIGRWRSAAQLSERSYRIRRKLHAIHHIDVIKSALNTADLLVLRHDWSAAERLLDELRTSLEQTGKSLRIPLALLQTRLARIYLATGRAATAERWLTEAWQEFQPRAAEHPLFVAEIAFAMGELHAVRRAAPRAGEFFVQAFSLQKQAHGPRHLDLAKTLIELGRNESAQGNQSAAQAHLEQAVSLREKLLGTQHPLTAQAWLHLAEIKCQQDAWDAVRELSQRALAALEQNPEPIPWLIAAACSLQSRTAQSVDHYEQAVTLAVRELELREQSSGSDHADLAPVLLRLGQLHQATDRIDQAILAFKRGLIITEKSRGPHDPAVIPFLTQLCSLRATDGPTSELGPLVARYMKCHQRMFGPQSGELSQAQDQAAEWWRAAGDLVRAQELNEQARSLRELSTHVFGELM